MTLDAAPSHFANDDAYWLRSNSSGDTAASPILLAVPHAGRDYPAYVLQNSRLPQTALQKLEDRYADHLIAKAVDNGHRAIVARAPRAWIDLNRDPADIDFQIVRNLPPDTSKTLLEQQSLTPANMKSSAGLGLIPSRLSGYGDLWRAPWAWGDVARRIDRTHQVYHTALGNALSARCDRHGCAVLLDVHSMPSLPKTRGINTAPAQIIFGNRHGQTADQALVHALARLVQSCGLSVGHNVPYAGGYVLNRHACSAQNIQAVQIEFDRALYLDSNGEPSRGIDDMQALMAKMADLAHDYACSYLDVQAAE